MLHLDGGSLFDILVLAIVDLTNDELGESAEDEEKSTDEANVVRGFAHGGEGPVGGGERFIEGGFFDEPISSLHELSQVLGGPSWGFLVLDHPDFVVNFLDWIKSEDN